MIDLSNQKELKRIFDEDKDKPITSQSVIFCNNCNKYHWRYDQCPKVMKDLCDYQMNKGRKFDKGKLEWFKAPWLLFEKIVESVMKHPDYRWDLLPVEPLENLVEILTYGANKYESNNWQKVEPHRYFNALIRHLIGDFIKGEDDDEESGKPHASHMHCNAMFLDWIKTQMKKKENKIFWDEKGHEI